MSTEKTNLRKAPTPKRKQAATSTEIRVGDHSVKLRHALGVVAAGLAIGIGWGIAIESHTNEVARSKVITAEYCRTATLDGAETINKDFIKCVEDGVPGGAKIGDDKFKAGEPTGYVDTYITAQNAEAASIEPGRIVAWSAAPFVAAISFGAVALS